MLLDKEVQDGINEVKESSNVFRKGLRFSRKEVSGKVRYEYDIFLDTDPVSEDTLKGVSYAKEQLDLLKNPITTPISSSVVEEIAPVYDEVIEEVATEEVTNFAEIMPANKTMISNTEDEVPMDNKENTLANLSKEALFDKLQNYKKLLDNGLILQGEYDRLKSEILKYL